MARVKTERCRRRSTSQEDSQEGKGPTSTPRPQKLFRTGQAGRQSRAGQYAYRRPAREKKRGVSAHWWITRINAAGAVYAAMDVTAPLIDGLNKAELAI